MAARTAGQCPANDRVAGQCGRRRIANFSLNGYARTTNLRLQQLPVISQQTVWACGTRTAVYQPD
jgi:hypothetical protein